MKKFRSATEGTWEPVRDANRPRKYFETMKFIPILDGRFETSHQILRNPDGKIAYRDFVVFGVNPDTHKLSRPPTTPTAVSIARIRSTPEAANGCSWERSSARHNSATVATP